MSEEFPAKCPACKSTRYHQDYTSLAGTLSLDNIDPKSVMRQGEINYAKQNCDIKAAKQEKEKNKKKPKAFWQEGAPDISKVKDKTKYILTGETN